MVELIRMVFSTQIDKHLSFDSFGDAHNIKSCRSDRWPMVDEIHLYRRYRTKRPKKSLKVIRDAGWLFVRWLRASVCFRRYFTFAPEIQWLPKVHH